MSVIDSFGFERDADAFRFGSPLNTGTRVLGGWLLASSVVAAGATVRAELAPVSLLAAFVAPGTSGGPIDVRVEHDGDTKRSAVRMVAVRDRERLLLRAIMRFHATSDVAAKGFEVAAPALLRPDQGSADGAAPSTMEVLRAFEFRNAVALDDGKRVLHPIWVRHRSPLPDDAVSHAAVLALLSDIGVSGSAVRPGAPMRERFGPLSIDHTLRWHRPVRCDDWLSIDVTSLSNTDGRGTATGEVRDGRGALVATLSQQVVLPRLAAPPSR